MIDHQFETRENQRVCLNCLRTEQEISRSGCACPGIPWYQSGQAPSHLSTRNQLKAAGRRPAPGQSPAGIVVTTGQRQVVPLYDVGQALPRPGDTPARQAARAATWANTARKWRCTHCGQQPEHLGELVFSPAEARGRV